MKKILTLIAVAAASFSFAAQNCTILNYTVPSNKTYSDGTPVLNGERYALVYLPESATGAFKLAANGKEVDKANGEILQVKPVYKYDGESQCYFNFQIQPDDTATYSEGTLRVYMMDTRVYGVDGAVSLSPLDENGHPTVVNSVTFVLDAQLVDVVVRSEKLSRTGFFMAPRPEKTVMPVGADAPPTPVITGLRLEKGKVILTVAKTVNYVQYDIAMSKTLTEEAKPVEKKTFNGDDGNELKIEVDIDPSAESGFFKVIPRSVK